MNSHQKLAILCQFTKFIILVLLTIVSILISKEVWDQYKSKATSFKQTEKEITAEESVTVVPSFWPLKNMNYSDDVPYQAREQWQLNSDFNLTFGVAEYVSIREKLELKNTNANYSIKHGSVGEVKFEKLISKWGDRYKISANLIHVKEPYHLFLKIEISKDIPDDGIPDVNVWFSSEKNSFGVLLTEWLDGEYFLLDKVKGFNALFFQPQKVIKLKSEKCQNSSYYECLSSKLEKENFSHCPIRCAAISLPMNTFPLCETLEEFKCSFGILTKLQNENSLSKCKPSCNAINMRQTTIYKENQEGSNAKRDVFVMYRFQNTNMKVEEEYLVQDFVGMLGSIGGTLGMCIGFSFVGFLFSILEHLQGFIKSFLCSKPNTIQMTDQKIIKVENKIEDMKTIKISLCDLNTRMQLLEEEMSKGKLTSKPNQTL